MEPNSTVHLRADINPGDPGLQSVFNIRTWRQCDCIGTRELQQNGGITKETKKKKKGRKKKVGDGEMEGQDIVWIGVGMASEGE